MGSKNVKAIAVRGTREVPVHDPQRVKELIKCYQKQIAQTVKENEFRLHGTPGLCESAEALGDMPIKYWDGDVWPEGAAKEGLRAGKVPPFGEMIKDYYDVRGWNVNGEPSDQTLNRLGLGSIDKE